MRLNRTFLFLILLALAAVPGGAGSLYPTEGGDLRRENHSLAPSPIQGPVKIQWESAACDDLGTPTHNPILLSDRVVQAFEKGMRCYDRTTGAHVWTWTC